MFSIVIPSYLKPYRNSPSNPEEKFIRALDSVLGQTMKEYELIVVSDGCDKTVELCEPYNLNLYKIPHKGFWGGEARNVGIEKATQDYIIYLDTDDYWGKQHLEKVADGMCVCEWQWFYFNDWIYSDGWIERKVNVKQKGQCGTSNIVHKRSLPIKWGSDYLHDWNVIQQLKKYKGKQIATPEYYCLHIPKKIDL